jgi:hypothetical protein
MVSNKALPDYFSIYASTEPRQPRRMISERLTLVLPTWMFFYFHISETLEGRRKLATD